MSEEKSMVQLGAEPSEAEGLPPAWDSDLAEQLYRSLYVDELSSDKLDSLLSDLEQRHKDALYSQLIYLLSHLRFEDAEARRYWREIVQHQQSMQQRLGTGVDLRVALVSYFLEVNRKLRSPKIIEMKLFEQAQASIYRDELTGLHNYRFFVEYLSQEIRRGERYGTPLSLVMIDVDSFKSYNDQHGHDAGNAVLTTIARLLASTLRKVDIAARYGGEEFCLILPGTLKIGAQIVAERARRMIEDHPFPGGSASPDDRLTVSMGIATYPADAREADELVRRADRAMYIAKASGKNQVQLYGHSCRSFRRIPTSMQGTWRGLGAEAHPLTTIDISEGGMLFRGSVKLPAGSLIDVDLTLPDGSQHVSVVGRVVQCEEQDHGAEEFEVAVSFVSLTSRDQSRLLNYVRELSPRSDAEDPSSLV